jgi:hypothetical protein
MELLEVLITLLQTLVTVPAGATTGTVVYQQLLIRLMKITKTLALLWNGFGYWNNQ